jgi:hypothetical protein
MALLAVTGCTDSADDKAKAQAKAAADAANGAPIITEAAAKDVVAKITASNNKANTALDPDQVTGYEAEAGLASDTAVLRSYVGRPLGEFDYEIETLLPPAADSGADFFVADTLIGSATQHYPLVLAKAGADWKVVHNAPLEVPLPALRKGGLGSVEVVAATDPGHTLVATPQQIAEQHAAALGKAQADGPFAGDAVTAKVRAQDEIRGMLRFENGAAPDSVAESSSLAPYPVRALRTSDGGALVAYTTRTEYTATKPGAEADLGPMLTKLGGRTSPGKVTVAVLNMWWTHVPAKGNGDKVTVLGGSNQPTEVN